MGQATNELRKLFRRLGIEHTCGYSDFRGGWFCEDVVTSAYPLKDESCRAITFVEDEDGRIGTTDDITPAMAVSMVVAASVEGRS